MGSLRERMRRLLPAHRRRGPDPFATLELQVRLARLSAELQEMDRERVPRFAIAHHAEAATRAYEMTLAEACRLVGVAPPEGRDRATRLIVMEAELLRLGWTW